MRQTPFVVSNENQDCLKNAKSARKRLKTCKPEDDIIVLLAVRDILITVGDRDLLMQIKVPDFIGFGHGISLGISLGISPGFSSEGFLSTQEGHQ